MQVTFDKGYQPHLVCDTSDSRPSLSGVYLDPDQWLVSSDGVRLSIIPCEFELEESSQSQDEDQEKFTGCIIPRELVETAAKQRDRTGIKIGAKLNGAEEISVLTNKGLTLTGHAIKGSYPQWRNIIPSHVEETSNLVSYGLDSKLFDQLCKAVHAYMGQSLRVALTGKTTPHIVIGSESLSKRVAFGLIMPINYSPESIHTALGMITALNPNKK
jgi:hypothetical protein